MIAHIQRQRFDLYAAGRRLHVERLCPAHAAVGPTLVFLHEGLGSIGQWRDFPAQLCIRVGQPGLVYERWGYGRSDPLAGSRPKDYLRQEAEITLPEVLAAFEIIDSPFLYAHSYGGSIALLFAAAYPDRVRAVISEAAHVLVDEVCLAGIRIARAAYEQGSLRNGLHRYHGANTDSMFRGWCDTWLRLDYRDWNMTAELSRITCPALIIQGEADEYGARAQVDAIADGVSGSAEVLWLPDCAHVPHHQARDRVLGAAGRFISEVCAKLCVIQP